MNIVAKISIIAAVIVASWSARAQQLEPDYYIFPLKSVAGYYSSNFGELRTNHFHSGIDIKTDGVEGKTVVAAADGYISRIFLSPWGFGLALYITHPNGTTTVYGHLQKFRDDIAAYVYKERHRLKQHRVDLYCGPNTFPVKQGDMIALSGNSGSSGGPHLHYEIRNTANQKTLNMITEGVITPKDDISPLIQKLHYIEIDSVDGVVRHNTLKSYDLTHDGTLYTPSQQTPIQVGRKGYFIIEVSDRKNNTQNRYGVYNLTAEIDGKCYFEYRNDGFTFDITRYCNSISYYPLQRSSRNEVIRLAKQQGCIDYFYPRMVNSGVITTQEGEQRKIRITATDDCLNSSTLEFEIIGQADTDTFQGKEINSATMAYYNKSFTANVDNIFRVEIPARSLYESTDIVVEEYTGIVKSSLSRPQLTAAYSVGSKDIPLHKSMKVSFDYKSIAIKPQQLVIATVTDKQEMLYLGGKYVDGVISVNTSSMGTFCLTCDTTAPTIIPKFSDGADMTGKRTISFQLKDNFAGVSSYSATIDGKWVAIDYAKGIASIKLADEGIKGGTTHQITISISDTCGNKASWSGTFVR